MYYEQCCYFLQIINWRTLHRLVKIKMNLGIYLCWEIEWWKRELKYTERERNLSYYNQTHAIKNRNNITINQGLYSKLRILYLCLTHILSFAIRIELLPFVQYFFIFSSSFITQQKFFCFSDDYETLFATKLCIDDISHKIAAFHYQMEKMIYSYHR